MRASASMGTLRPSHGDVMVEEMEKRADRRGPHVGDSRVWLVLNRPAG
jgi:hypothetical protein